MPDKTIELDVKALERLNHILSDWSVDMKRVHRFFAAWPKKEGRFPAVMVIHDWYGLNDHVKELCARLAKEDFIAMAPDFYREFKDTSVNHLWTRRFMNVYTPDEVLEMIRMALIDLKNQDGVLRNQIGMIGFGKSGVYPLLAANRIPGLKGAIGFVSHLPADQTLMKNIECPVLLFSEENPKEKARDVSVGGNPDFPLYQISIKPSAMKSFFDESTPPKFSMETGGEAWECVIKFLKEKVGTAEIPRVKKGIFNQLFGKKNA